MVSTIGKTSIGLGSWSNWRLMIRIYCSWLWRKRTASMLWINGDIEWTWSVSLRYAGQSCTVCRIQDVYRTCRLERDLRSPKFQKTQWLRIQAYLKKDVVVLSFSLGKCSPHSFWPQTVVENKRAHTATLYVQDGSINILTTWWFSNGMTTLKTSCSASNCSLWMYFSLIGVPKAPGLFALHRSFPVKHSSPTSRQLGWSNGRSGRNNRSIWKYDTEKKSLAFLSSKDMLEIDIFPPRECCVCLKGALIWYWFDDFWIMDLWDRKSVV